MKIDFSHNKKSDTGFTLIELLIVIGILATLSVVAVLVINPTEITKKARDSRRMEELASINKTLQIAEVQGSISFGSSTTVYVSIPDTSSVCANLGLPTLPSGWSYACQTLANYRKVDGNGWIPVNFTSISFGSPLSILPIDPVNATSTGNYYTYVTGGSYELTSLLESDRYEDKAINDGDAYPGVYSVRTSASPLTPGIRDKGMVGYWQFEEASDTLYDSSGYGNNGTQSGGVTYGQPGKVGNALSFDGVDDAILCTRKSSLIVENGNFTVEAWIKPTSNITTGGRYTVAGFYSPGWMIDLPDDSDTEGYRFYDGINSYKYTPPGGLIALDWTHYAAVRNGSLNKVYIYLNGGLKQTFNVATVTASTGNLRIGRRSDGFSFNGLIDDARIYNRALSAAEIAAIYNATK